MSTKVSILSYFKYLACNQTKKCWNDYIQIRMAKMENMDNTNACEDTKKFDHLYIASENVKWHSHTRKHSAIFQSTKHATTI